MCGNPKLLTPRKGYGWVAQILVWLEENIYLCLLWLLKRVVVEDFEGRVKMDFPLPKAQKSTVCPHPTPISVWFLSDMSRHSVTFGFCLCSTSYIHTHIFLLLDAHWESDDSLSCTI